MRVGTVDATRDLRNKIARGRNPNPQNLDEGTLKALADLKKQLKTFSKNELVRMVGSLLVEKQMTIAMAKQAEEEAKKAAGTPTEPQQATDVTPLSIPVDEFSQQLQQETIEQANA